MTFSNEQEKSSKLIKCLKILLEVAYWGITLFFTSILAYVCLSLVNQTLPPKIGALFPEVPKEIGKETSLKTSERLEKAYHNGEILIPYDYLSENELLGLFFTETDEGVTDEKYQLLSDLIPYDSNEKIAKCMEAFQLIPNELLLLMKEDELEITLADVGSVAMGGGMMTTGTYRRAENRIIIYNSNYMVSTVIHEVGHWIESYLKRNVDYHVLERMSDEMREEFKFLGLDSFGEEYATSDKYEMFATIFEHYILDYEKLRMNAPISHDYMTYYLERLLT